MTEPIVATRRRRRRARRTSGRVAASVALAVGLAAVVVGAAASDPPADPAAPEAVVVGPGDVAPVARAAGALGATWFCPAGNVAHTVVLENPSAEPIGATVTVYGGAADSDPTAAAAAAALPPATAEVEIPASGALPVALADILDAPFTAALVEVHGGGVAVEHLVSSVEGVDAVPCASAPSSTWYLPAGSTTRDASETVTLFNPFPDDAVVDLTFTTTDGYRAPQEYAGYIVPGGRVAVLDIAAVVGRHDQVATAVRARSGRLVVGRLQVFDSTAGPAGYALTTAAPAPAEVWTFPDGLATDTTTESVTVFNPGERSAEVDVEFALDQPEVNGAVDPVQLTIAPGAYAQVLVNQEQRVPLGVGHAITVRAVGVDPVPVVAERWVRASAPRSGFSASIGSPVSAARWLFPVGATTPPATEALAVANPGRADVTVSVAALTATGPLAIDGLQDVTVPAGGRVVLDLGASVNRDALPLVVEASGPVVVERGLYRAGAAGIGQSPGVAVEAGAVLRRTDDATAPPG